MARLPPTFTSEEDSLGWWEIPGGTSFNTERFRDWVYGRIYGRSRINFPVGRRDLSVQQQGLGVPPMVTEPSDLGEAGIPPAIDRRDLTPQQGELQVFKSWADWVKAGNVLPPDYSSYPTPGSYPTAPTYLPEPTGGSMDLGDTLVDLVGQLGSAAIADRFGPQQPTPVGYGPTITTPVDVGIPFVDVISEPPSDCSNYAYKKVCGQYKWVKIRKRRRKRLATASDIADLAKLKGVLGQGKAMETWIATHS